MDETIPDKPPYFQTVPRKFTPMPLAESNGTFVALGLVHAYPPHQNAGGPLTMHALLRHGAEHRGWTAKVIVDRADQWAGVVDGVAVRSDRNVRTITTEARSANAIFTQLQGSARGLEIAQGVNKLAVLLVHHATQIKRVSRRGRLLVVFNSHHVHEDSGWRDNHEILYPPVILDEYRVKPGDAITMVNLKRSKGVDLFYTMAALFPQYQFIGVQGSYGDQVPAPPLPNLTILPNMADITEVYAQTRLLLVPSFNETWGRTAIEAACSGIPSICSPTKGLLEAKAGVAFIDPHDPTAWATSLEIIMENEDVWAQASEAALTRATELEEISAGQLKRVTARIESFA